MPLRDGTGPFGSGPAWGRGRGGCRGFGFGGIHNGPFQRKGGWLMGIMAPLLAVIVRDLLNPQGFLGKALKSAAGRRLDVGVKKNVKNADYSIIEEDPQSAPLKRRGI